jgi:K+-transporting ATPase, A chain
MNSFDLTQIIVFLLALLILAYPLGNYMALVYTGALCPAGSFLKRSEEAVFRFCQLDGEEKMGWQTYAVTMLIFNALGMFLSMPYKDYRLSYRSIPRRYRQSLLTWPSTLPSVLPPTQTGKTMAVRRPCPTLLKCLP